MVGGKPGDSGRQAAGRVMLFGKLQEPNRVPEAGNDNGGVPGKNSKRKERQEKQNKQEGEGGAANSVND